MSNDEPGEVQVERGDRHHAGRGDEEQAGLQRRGQQGEHGRDDDDYRGHLGAAVDHLRLVAPNLHVVGRNGMHRYNNQDHSVMTGLLVARNIALGTVHDPWLVNGDAEYHEGPAGEVSEGRLSPRRVVSERGQAPQADAGGGAPVSRSGRRSTPSSTSPTG